MVEFEFPDVVENLDATPEDFRVAYDKNTEGKYVLKDTFKPFVTAARGNYAALQVKTKDLTKSNAEAADRRKVIKAFEDWAQAAGIAFDDKKPLLDALKEHVDTLQASAKNGSELKVNLDRIKADYDRQTAAVKAESDGKVTKMRGSLERHMIGDAANAALGKLKGTPELLLPIVRSQAKVVEEGDSFVARVVDSDNNIRIDPKTGQPMTIEGLVAEMKTNPVYARAFESEARGGAGSQQQTQQRQAPAKVVQGEKTSKDKIAAGLANRGK